MLANKVCPTGTGSTTTTVVVSTTPTTAESNPTKIDESSTDTVGPVTKRPKVRPTPYSKSILLGTDRRNRKRKSLSWQPDETIQKVHYFEFIADERVNVNRVNDLNQSANEQAATSQGVAGTNPHANRLNSIGRGIAQADVDPPSRRINASTSRVDNNDAVSTFMTWKLISIDFTPVLPSPGWNSVERSAQAVRETCVLGAIDLPGQLSTLDEPDGSSGGEPNAKDDPSSGVTLIPLDNPEGMYTEYPDMSSSEIVNGVRIAPTNSQPVAQNMTTFSNSQPSQILPNQFQQQLINVSQSPLNPFSFQEMSAQFQQQQQQFPFSQQQQSQNFQTQFATQLQQMQTQPQSQPQTQPQLQAPFLNNQQQPGLTGPIMPWLNYPFSQVNDNSHAHLFRRPAT